MVRGRMAEGGLDLAPKKKKSHTLCIHIRATRSGDDRATCMHSENMRDLLAPWHPSPIAVHISRQRMIGDF